MKEFITAIEEATEDQDEALVFSLDGRELRAYKPTDGQIAMTMASLGRHTSDGTKIAGIIDFFVTVMDDQSHQYVVDRLLSREDPLGLLQVEEVLSWMVEEWTGRPTQPLSVSTPSRANGGRKSKPRTSVSTS
jgi:hypothetical protein